MHFLSFAASTLNWGETDIELDVESITEPYTEDEITNRTCKAVREGPASNSDASEAS